MSITLPEAVFPLLMMMGSYSTTPEEGLPILLTFPNILWGTHFRATRFGTPGDSREGEVTQYCPIEDCHCLPAMHSLPPVPDRPLSPMLMQAWWWRALGQEAGDVVCSTYQWYSSMVCHYVGRRKPPSDLQPQWPVVGSVIVVGANFYWEREEEVPVCLQACPYQWPCGEGQWWHSLLQWPGRRIPNPRKKSIRNSDIIYVLFWHFSFYTPPF